MITVRIVDGTGNTRFFQFTSPEIRIGFRLGADVSLTPHEQNGPELRIIEDETGTHLAEPISEPGAFSMSGTDIIGTVPLKAGDVLAVGSYHISIEELVSENAPETVAEVLTPGPDESGDAGPRATDDSAEPKLQQQQSAEDYLRLFFAPIADFLDEDNVSEVMINGPKQIYVERKGKLQLTDAEFINEQALQAAVKNVARSVGRYFNHENPRLDARFPDGSRVHAVIPPLARTGTVVAIRKFSKDKLTMPQLVKFGSITEEGAKLIDAVVKLHKNVIVSGPTSSGKTSVLNVLSGFIEKTERIIVIEDASELQLQQDHIVGFETRKADEHGKGEVTIRDLVISSLRLRPDRLIIGEIRGGEALDMLQAMNTGHSGSMSTIHANSPVDCLSRIETCSLLSGIEIPLSAIRSQVASAINVVVHTARLSDGSRKITSVAEVMPLANGEYVTQDLIRFETEGLDSEGNLLGSHVGTGVLPTFFEEAALRGIELEASWFDAPGKS